MSSNKKSLSEDYITTKIFGWQKVKLYDLKHFIFDFGGVMVEKTFVLKNLFEMIENDLDIKLPSKYDPEVRKFRRRMSSGRLSAREFLEIIFEKYYYPVKKLDEQESHLARKKPNIEYYLELWFQLYSQMTSLSKEMEEIMERMHQAGYKLSLMSNTYGIHAKLNELRGFYSIFDNVFLSNEIGLLKPDLEKYKYVLNKLDTKPKKCVFIDDKIQNLVPARELGMYVIRFRSLKEFKEQISDLGIGPLSKNRRHEIRAKYKHYKIKKKEFKSIKKEYKKAKKEFLQKKGRSLKRKEEYEKKRDLYLNKKLEFQKEKDKKREELQAKIKLD